MIGFLRAVFQVVLVTLLLTNLLQPLGYISKRSRPSLKLVLVWLDRATYSKDVSQTFFW